MESRERDDTLVSIHNANLATLSQWEAYLGAGGLPDISVAIENRRSILAELKTVVLSELGRNVTIRMLMPPSLNLMRFQPSSNDKNRGARI